MKYAFIISFLLSFAVNVMGQNTRYYTNKKDKKLEFDSSYRVKTASYEFCKEYLYYDSINHPLLLPCKHRQSYRFVRMVGELKGAYYCDVCHNKIWVCFTVLDSLNYKPELLR